MNRKKIAIGAVTVVIGLPVLLILSCGPRAAARPSQQDRSHDASSRSLRSVGADSLPPIGLAVADSARTWCAEFLVDSAAPSLEPGRHVTIVFAGPAAVPSLGARLGRPHPGECPAAFPQPRWIDYVAYRLELIDSFPTDAAALPTVALVVVSEARWARGPDGVVRADADGDGEPEEARRCTADEGEHFTLWSLRPGDGRVRRWHEYYDWGGVTDPTCRPGEDGREPSRIGTP